MPIYEYRCDNGHEVEVMQPMSADALTKCPDCGAPTRRVLHSPAIHFKGSGFHNTDYGTRSANKAKQAAAAAAKDSGGDSGSSSESGSSSSGDSSGSSDSSGGDSGSKKADSKPAKSASSSD